MLFGQTSLAAGDLSESRPDTAHQLLCVSEDGQLAGDDIICHPEENLFFSIHGVSCAGDRVKFHAGSGDYEGRARGEMTFGLRPGTDLADCLTCGIAARVAAAGQEFAPG